MSVGIDNRKYGRRLLLKSLFVKLRATYPHGYSVPVAVQSKAYVCGCSMVGIAGSDTAGDMDARLLCLLCR